MKRTTTVVVMSGLAFFLTIGYAAKASDVSNQNQFDLVLLIDGLENDEGDVKIAMSNSKQDYDAGDNEMPFRRASVRAGNRKATYVFRSLPYGEYAIKLFHDRNGNGRLDKNFLGIPKRAVRVLQQL